MTSLLYKLQIFVPSHETMYHLDEHFWPSDWGEQGNTQIACPDSFHWPWHFSLLMCTSHRIIVCFFLVRWHIWACNLINSPFPGAEGEIESIILFLVFHPAKILAITLSVCMYFRLEEWVKIKLFPCHTCYLIIPEEKVTHRKLTNIFDYIDLFFLFPVAIPFWRALKCCNFNLLWLPHKWRGHLLCFVEAHHLSALSHSRSISLVIRREERGLHHHSV